MPINGKIINAVMKNILNLIRWKNLLIIVFTLWLVKFALIDMQSGVVFPISHFEFLLCIIAAVLVAAAGYMINDVFDQQIDEINKPEKRLVGKVFSENSVKTTYFVLNLFSLVITVFVFHDFFLWTFIIIQISAIITFFIYTKYLKNRGLLGNITVAFFSGILPFGIFLLFYLNDNSSNEIADKITWISLAYSLFAFLISFMREIVKDMEDREGDEKTGCKTFAVTSQPSTVKALLAVLVLMSYILILVFQIYLFVMGEKIFAYSFFLLHLLLLFDFLPKVIKAKETKDYTLLSKKLKIIMAIGILLLLNLSF
jgi:4-hydroxybenzoate polyprenyltransferase